MRDDKILKVTEDITWTGVLDHDIITFDIVMETKNGTTYNSYFIDADKRVLVDTVKESFFDTYLDKLKQVTDPAEIEYIICTHTEPDHSGSLGQLLDLAPEATVVGSGQAINYLAEMVGKPFKWKKVKDGDTLDLGNKTIRFIGAPNLHWPDTIYAYLEEEKTLFTCDSFGAHYADPNMFDDQVDDYAASFDYYFDVILKPYSKFMLKAIGKIEDLEIDRVCPGHGPILRSTWKEKVNRSKELAEAYMHNIQKQNRVLIAYISAYGYTREMAVKISEGLQAGGQFDIDLVDIENILLGDLEEKVVRADAIIVGSPTINQNTLLPIYKLFSVINPIRDKGKPAAVFGSYGWSGEAVKLIEDHLANLKLQVTSSLSAKFYPNGEKAEEIFEFGKAFGKQLLEQE
ncbi:MAG: FprA family A-type flavoprotein [Bacteroidales bacterium]|nr:FprA family A-type flavoprotein [Bacteroidales bacterium]MDT8431081.1 FprA family A-type flavoprotein [Bacteroidales bacterium]